MKKYYRAVTDNRRLDVDDDGDVKVEFENEAGGISLEYVDADALVALGFAVTDDPTVEELVDIAMSYVYGDTTRALQHRGEVPHRVRRSSRS